MNLRTLLIASLLSVSCNGSSVKWPEVLSNCTPTPDTLGNTVRDLLGGRDYRDTLKDLALTQGVDTVLCAVKDVQRQLTKAGASADASFCPAQLDAANTFLAEAGTEFR